MTKSNAISLGNVRQFNIYGLGETDSHELAACAACAAFLVAVGMGFIQLTAFIISII